jgi:peptide chain release factor subunit 1
MTTTVSDSVLRELAALRSQAGCALSIYLDLDPSSTPTIPAAEKRFNATLTEAEKKVRGNRCRGLRDDLVRIRSWWRDEFVRDGAHGVAVFSSSTDDFFRALLLSESAGDAVHIGPRLLVTPLATQLGDDGSLVAFVSRERGTVYRIEAGRLVEVLDASEEQPGRHDQGGWSQANYQRHIEHLVLQHLKTVGVELDRTLRRSGSPPIVIVASEETRAELERELSSEVRSAVVGWTSAEAHASPTELLRLARPFFVEERARAEHDVLERWREAYGRGERAASGWKQVLDAVSDGRAEVLLLPTGAKRQVWECPDCGRVSADGGSCPLDGTRLAVAEDGVDASIHQALAHGGTFLWFDASALPDGAPAALLRY